MQASTSQILDVKASCVWPREAPSQQRDPDEVDLVTRLHARDESAFREIVERYASRIYRACYGILGDRDNANDVAQEVFAKVHFAIQGFAGRSPLYAWVCRITVNECYGFLRKKRLNTTYSCDSLDDAQTPGIEIAAMQRDFINKLPADFPDEDRWLLIGKEVERFSIGELSQMTGLKEKTIKSRLFRDRQALAAAASRRVPSVARFPRSEAGTTR